MCVCVCVCVCVCGGGTPGSFLSLSHVCASPFMLFSRSATSDSVTPWTAACQASLSFTVLQSVLELTSIEVAEDIQTSYPLVLTSSPAFNLSQHQGLF